MALLYYYFTAFVLFSGCRLGPDVFAVAPFLDLANHSIKPNSDFRMAASTATGGDRTNPSGSIELFALQDIPADSEVLISYTGPEGMTNQRLMAQYGFVLPGGNPSDRVVFQLPATGSQR